MTIIEKMIDVEGSPVHYLECGEGNGRTLLLLHGGIGDARANWHQVLPPLAEKFHAFAPDLPGFGTSAALPEMTIEKLLHWLHALIDALGQSDTVIVGTFFGGLLARLFAAAEPQYVPALILVNGGAIPRLPAFVAPLARLPVIGDSVLQLYGRVSYINTSPEHVVYVQDAVTDGLRESWRGSAAGFAALMRAALVYTYPEKQKPLVPTLLLWGANDRLMPIALAERLKSEIPGAVLAPIADCGHMPHLEASDAFVFQLTSFLDQLSRGHQPTLPGVGLLRSD